MRYSSLITNMSKNINVSRETSFMYKASLTTPVNSYNAPLLF